MRIPLRWLRDYVDIDEDPDRLADLLIRLGHGIDGIETDTGELGGAVLIAEITPNRGDCLSMLGIAREVAAATGAELRLPGAELIESPTERIDGRCQVRIEAPDLCPRYAARLVTGVDFGPSPIWMQARLKACGQRPLNILVDVTNYVLFEVGQPLHAFDYDLLGPEIIVRRAYEGETLVTLDDVKRTLTAEQLVIADPERAVALAGVMGGASTEVTERTSAVLLEAAHFHGPNIRRTARRLGLESESSYRFARTVDPDLPIRALNRAASLLSQYAGGVVAAGVVDVVARPIQSAMVGFRPSRCRAFLGADIDNTTMRGYLTALGMHVTDDGERFYVKVPTWRPDVSREVDLIEEIARLHGYDRIPATVPPPARETGRLSLQQRLERRVRELLLGFGLNEVWTFSLTCRPAMARARLGRDPRDVGAVAIENALSEEYCLLRWSLLPAMLEVVARNRSWQGDAVRIFEVGRCYGALDSQVGDAAAREVSRVTTGRTAARLPMPCREQLTLAGAVTGKAMSSAWNIEPPALAADFFEVKGMIELLLSELGLADAAVQTCDDAIFEPGRAARFVVRDHVFGQLGEAAEEVRRAYDLAEPVVLFELDLGWMLEVAEPRRTYRPLPRFPAALRDLAVVVPTETPAADVADAITTAAGGLLESLRLFDVYEGKGIPEGRRSLAYNLRFRRPDRTLTDTEVDRVVAHIVDVLAAEFDARLRE